MSTQSTFFLFFSLSLIFRDWSLPLPVLYYLNLILLRLCPFTTTQHCPKPQKSLNSIIHHSPIFLWPDQIRFRVGKSRTSSSVCEFGLRPEFSCRRGFRRFGYSNSRPFRSYFRVFSLLFWPSCVDQP